MKRAFKYFIDTIDNIIIKGVHITICNHNGGENFISTIIANKTIKIFKKNIAKKLAPSPTS
jgi:tRNA A37 threonylcarbamoyladenosine dehydratase